MLEQPAILVPVHNAESTQKDRQHCYVIPISIQHILHVFLLYITHNRKERLLLQFRLHLKLINQLKLLDQASCILIMLFQPSILS